MNPAIIAAVSIQEDDMGKGVKSKRISQWLKIAYTVAAHYEVSPSSILNFSGDKSPRAARIRHLLVAVFIRRRATPFVISSVFSTPLSNASAMVSRIRARLEEDESFRSDVVRLERILVGFPLAAPERSVRSGSRTGTAVESPQHDAEPAHGADAQQGPDFREIKSVVCKSFGFSMPELKNARRRSSELDHARAVLYFLLRKLTKKSFPKIGKFVRRDHSSIVTSYHKMAARYDAQPGLRLEIDALIYAIEARVAQQTAVSSIHADSTNSESATDNDTPSA